MILEPDVYLYKEDGTYLHSVERSSVAWAKTTAELQKAVRSRIFDKVTFVTGLPASGKSTWVERFEEEWVVYLVDADLVGRGLREKMITLIREFDKEIPITIVFLDTNKTVCLERNSKRTPDRIIPLGAYREMGSVFCYPSTEEGFCHIHFKSNFSI